MRTHRFDIAITFACFALLGYFAWHAWEGPRGYPYRAELAITMAEHEIDLSAVHLKRMVMEKKVALLQPDQVDPDMLDELARGRLELARPNEVVGITDQISKRNP